MQHFVTKKGQQSVTSVPKPVTGLVTVDKPHSKKSWQHSLIKVGDMKICNEDYYCFSGGVIIIDLL